MDDYMATVRKQLQEGFQAASDPPAAAAGASTGPETALSSRTAEESARVVPANTPGALSHLKQLQTAGTLDPANIPIGDLMAMLEAANDAAQQAAAKVALVMQCLDSMKTQVQALGPLATAERAQQDRVLRNTVSFPPPPMMVSGPYDTIAPATPQEAMQHGTASAETTVNPAAASVPASLSASSSPTAAVARNSASDACPATGPVTGVAAAKSIAAAAAGAPGVAKPSNASPPEDTSPQKNLSGPASALGGTGTRPPVANPIRHSGLPAGATAAATTDTVTKPPVTAAAAAVPNATKAAPAAPARPAATAQQTPARTPATNTTPANRGTAPPAAAAAGNNRPGAAANNATSPYAAVQDAANAGNTVVNLGHNIASLVRGGPPMSGGVRPMGPGARPAGPMRAGQAPFYNPYSNPGTQSNQQEVNVQSDVDPGQEQQQHEGGGGVDDPRHDVADHGGDNNGHDWVENTGDDGDQQGVDHADVEDGNYLQDGAEI